MKNRILTSVIFLAVVLSAPVLSATPAFYLIPDSTVVFRDSLFDVFMPVDAASANLKAFSVEISFNRGVVRTDSVSVTEGPLLATAGLPTFFWVGFSPDSSKLYIDGAILGDGFTASGSGLLATIRFYTIGFGMSDLEFTSIRARNGDNEPLVYNSVDGWVKVCQFVGDVNADNRINISDVVYMINWIFGGGPEPIPDQFVGDVNCDSTANVSDVVYLINYIFSGGPAPCGPCY
jgi:hypothetical protein